MVTYYENILANHNYVAKPDSVWVADITNFDLGNKKIYVFFCIDIFSNRILATVFKVKPITSSEIIKKLEDSIDKRFPIRPRKEVIIHTDRGSQFTSKAYNDFVRANEGYIRASMSRANSPKDNAVAERFIRTFKEHKIDDKTFQEELLSQLEMNSKFKGYRKIFNRYVKNLDLKPNTKSKMKSPEQHDNDSRVASMLMVEPKYSKALSELYGTDFRREHIDIYKLEKKGVISILEEIARRAEIVDKTPFDSYEDNLAIKIINDQLKAIYGLIQSNPDITREYVEESLLPIQDSLDNIEEKVNLLLPKRKKQRNILPLRDPINMDLFNVFFVAAGSSSKYKIDLKCAQLKIAYTILFHTGLRVNEIRLFTEKDIQDAIKTSQFSVVHFKQKEPHIHVISDSAVQALKKLKYFYEIVFIKYKYQYLFGKNKPASEKHLIFMINSDLKHTCEINRIPYNIKSHSFRIHMISKLLKNTSVQNAADIIGHRDIQSTMAYKRYALNKKEIKELLENLNEDVDKS